MPGDQVTRGEGRAVGPGPGFAAAVVRAMTFTVVGSVLAAVGHHAVDGGQVPWRLVAALAVAQFAAVRPLARRRPGLLTVAGGTLAAQAALHLALGTAAGGGHHGTGHTGTEHLAHAGRSATAEGGGGHPWQHTAGAMTAAHVCAALLVAWLLHRADAAITAVLVTGRTLRALAVAVLSRLLPTGTAAVQEPPPAPPTRSLDRPAGPRTTTLEHTLVRRGPPGRTPVPLVPFTRVRPSRPARFHQQGVPLCPRPRRPQP
ncbi:hypothetical protein C6Y14_40815 [Streptomyces dioscori]|uniref:Integral membrane protein n=1 Tax=Streptomyces dioscori TaxID=2109333 RepID=A0A2P8PUH2_9ACTN|nr:hypothetical protein [Streptomyces dioscori]PSM37661.1 hypothetical protein C6Y14_40815 [Streptomyces dioscori]